MALAIVHTRAQLGIEAPPVAVEVHLSGGLPSFALSVMGGCRKPGVRKAISLYPAGYLNSAVEAADTHCRVFTLTFLK